MGKALHRSLLGFSCVLVLLSSLQATPTIFTGDDPGSGESGEGKRRSLSDLPNSSKEFARFRLSLLDVVEETFEAFPVSDAVQDLKSGTIGATISGGAIQEPPKSLGHIDGKFALSGDKLLSAKGPITVRFTSPQSAFGLFITDAENDSRDVVLIDSKGERSTYRVPAKIPQGSSGCIFFGIIDHDRPFVAVEISGSGTEGFGFDDMMIGRIPEVGAPASTRIDTYAGLTIEGTPQTLYRIEVSATPDFVEWFTQTTIRLPTSPFLYIDPQPISTRTRLYYRAIPE